jgi:hypothetical protein
MEVICAGAEPEYFLLWGWTCAITPDLGFGFEHTASNEDVDRALTDASAGIEASIDRRGYAMVGTARPVLR